MKSFKNLFDKIMFLLGYVPKQDPASFDAVYFHPIDMVTFSAYRWFVDIPDAKDAKFFKSEVENELIHKAFNGKITSYEWENLDGKFRLKVSMTAMLPRISNPFTKG